MNDFYISTLLSDSNKKIDINYYQILKDFLVLITSLSSICTYIYLFKYLSNYITTYLIGALLLVTIVPISIKIIIKFILSITVGYFIDINNIFDNFLFGFTFFIVGIVLFILFLIVNIMTLFTFSIASISIGSCLLLSI